MRLHIEEYAMIKLLCLGLIKELEGKKDTA